MPDLLRTLVKLSSSLGKMEEKLSYFHLLKINLDLHREKARNEIVSCAQGVRLRSTMD